jgi:hypothetical protein
MLIGRSSQSQPAFPGQYRPAAPRAPPSCHLACGRRAGPPTTGQDTRLACRSQPVPAAAEPAQTPGGAAPSRNIPGWDAGTPPCRALALGRRGRSRPRLPPGEASRTLPRGLRIPHTSVPARAGLLRIPRGHLHSKFTLPTHPGHRAPSPASRAPRRPLAPRPGPARRRGARSPPARPRRPGRPRRGCPAGCRSAIR